MKDKLKKLCEGIWNVPNVLTMLRIALIPVFLILYCNNMPKASLVVFLAASFTDYLDGYLARKLNQITAFGHSYCTFERPQIVMKFRCICL